MITTRKSEARASDDAPERGEKGKRVRGERGEFHCVGIIDVWRRKTQTPTSYLMVWQRCVRGEKKRAEGGAWGT
jgi:hypothetical protein